MNKLNCRLDKETIRWHNINGNVPAARKVAFVVACSDYGSEIGPQVTPTSPWPHTRYNRSVNVPAARMVAERPSPVIRRCGIPSAFGTDSTAWPGASPHVGPHVA